jgi:uncharacterized protein (TIGR02270 family)
MGARMKQSDAALAFIRELCLEHFEEASHLWLLRGKAVQSPGYGLADLLELDNRLDAHVDALRMQALTCRELGKESLERAHAGEYFSAAVLAFENADETLVEMMIEKAEAAPGLSAGIVSALGWLPWEHAQPHIRHLLASGSTDHRYIGIAASALHRRDPGHHLDDALYSGDARLKTCGLRTIGELGGRGDRMTLARLQDHFTAADEESRFWAAWSAALLGDEGAVHVLKPFVEPRSPFREKALNLAMRLMDGAAALAWQKDLSGIPCGQWLAVIAAGISGDPALMPWLLERMPDPALARVAGEAFTMITGVDMAREGLEGKWPKGFTAGPNDDPRDDNVALDPDEGLPWPDAQLIAAWWDKNRGLFPGGRRCLAGKPMTAESLLHVLETGRQPQRAAAALELAILRPGRPLFDVCAPAFLQNDAGRKQ